MQHAEMPTGEFVVLFVTRGMYRRDQVRGNVTRKQVLMQLTGRETQLFAKVGDFLIVKAEMCMLSADAYSFQ